MVLGAFGVGQVDADPCLFVLFVGLLGLVYLTGIMSKKNSYSVVLINSRRTRLKSLESR